MSSYSTPGPAGIPGGGGSLRGRGAAENPANRFERIALDTSEDETPVEERSLPRTQFLRDAARSILSRNDSPDIPFETSLNPYRGCEHGCIYCYARPFHEYLGFSVGLDFETRILVKEDAPALLRAELLKPSWKPQVIAMSGVTDPYQPAERRLKVTRGCLEVLTEFRNPVGVITKNAMVTRDIDLLAELARHHAVTVNLSITTLDSDLARVLEPRASHPEKRLAAIKTLAGAGIPVGVMVAPVIPGLTEPEMPAIVEAAVKAGATSAGYITMRLPHGVAPLFEAWLERHYPARKDKVLNRIRALRGGRLNDPRYAARMRGEGIFAREIEGMFKLACHRAGLPKRRQPISAAAFRHPRPRQLGLFE